MRSISLLPCLTAAVTLHAAATFQPVRADDIVDTAVAAGSFETLATALTKADLVGALRSDGPFTVFAPNDEAFARVDRHVLQDLLKPKNRDRLASILTFHVVPGRLTARDVAAMSAVTTLNGQRIEIAAADGRVTIDGADLVAVDIECDNGIIHVIDSVMMPSTQDIVEIAASAGAFTTLLAAAQAAGLADTLAGDGPFTVLAPTDEAFGKIPPSTIETLLKPESRPQLASILKYHVIPGRVFAAAALEQGRATTAQGAAVAFALRGGRLTVNGANVLDNDIDASNGVIHVIDTVLMPPASAAPQGRLVVGLYTDSVDGALAAQLDLEPGTALLVTGVTSSGNAKASGILKYDVITRINDRPATSANLDRAKKESGFGNPVRMTVVRRGKTLRIDVPVGVVRH